MIANWMDAVDVRAQALREVLNVMGKCWSIPEPSDDASPMELMAAIRARVWELGHEFSPADLDGRGYDCGKIAADLSVPDLLEEVEEAFWARLDGTDSIADSIEEAFEKFGVGDGENYLK